MQSLYESSQPPPLPKEGYNAQDRVALLICGRGTRRRRRQREEEGEEGEEQ
jgi:hypothetical protein